MDKSRQIIYKFCLVILVLSLISLSLGAKGCPTDIIKSWIDDDDIVSGSSGEIEYGVSRPNPNCALAKTPWPMFGHDPQHTGCTPSTGPNIPRLRWHFSIPYSFRGPLTGPSPAIGINGTIYIGSRGGTFYAITPMGNLKSSCSTVGCLCSTPAISLDGTVYVSSTGGPLYAISPNGTLKWTYTTVGLTSSPVIAPDGTIYVTSEVSAGLGKLHAINSDGTLKWARTIEGGLLSPPALSLNGTIYVSSVDDLLYAINPDGTLKWTYTGIWGWTVPISSPAVGPDNTVYISSCYGTLYAIRSDGTLKWSYVVGDGVEWFNLSPAIASDGTIYLTSWHGKLHAIGSNGTFKWTYSFGHYMGSTSPVVDSKGTIYIGGYFGSKLYAIDPSGGLKWSHHSGEIDSSPAIGSDGTIYVGTRSGLYAIGNKNPIIKADEPSTINTSEDETQPDCEISVPAGAVEEDTEVSLTSFHMECIDCVNACSNTVTALHSNLPAPLPEGYTLLGGGNLKPIKPDKVNFTPGKEADSYVILPPSVRAEELSTADIKLMEFIDGHWVIVLPNKKGKVITTGPKAGYIGPDESAPAKLTGARPWCWVKVTSSGDATQSTEVGWAQVAAGWTHTIALKTNGTLWAWGYNYFGQLGLGDSGSRTEINTPTQIGIDTDWAEVIPGAYYTIALKTNGTLWAWGDNTSGQLGLGDIIDRTTPTKIGTDTDWSAVAARGYHTVALKTDGTLWTWGDNSNGQLGLGGTTGCNYYGQSGPLGDTTHRTLPTQIGTGSDWVVVAAGWYYTIALKRNGTLWAWGYNEYGQLGLRDTMDRNTPTQIGTDTDWAAIACENGHAFALKTDGTLWAWGNNGHGQLGLGHTADKNTPTQIGTDTNWVAVAAGYGHTIALKTDGTLWAWGWNLYSQLGLGDTIERHSPVQVGTDTNWVAVACGYDYTIALKTNGTLWTLRIVITRVE